MSSDSNAPGLNILASSYDVLRGKYADVSSVKQTILDWDKGTLADVESSYQIH